MSYDPQLVRSRRGEVALHQVLTLIRAAAWDRGPRALRAADPAQACGSHEPLHRAPGHLQALPPQLRVDLPGPVDPVVGLMHPPDFHEHLLIAQATH